MSESGFIRGLGCVFGSEGGRFQRHKGACRKVRIFAVCLLVSLSATQAVWSAEQPKNVIFFIGDGMGPNHVTAAGMYAYGLDYDTSDDYRFSFEKFPYQAVVTTASADGPITDSAAAATALATGFKVNNLVISMAYPANPGYAEGSEMETLLEYYQARGRSTGLVTTTYITHATPAAFGAHEPDRGNLSNIAEDYLVRSRPNVLLGGGANGMDAASAQTAGYTVVTDRAEMQGLNTESETMVSGQFGSGGLPYEYDENYDTLPHLSEMTETALQMLDNDPDGFFLMVEGGKIDWAAHGNELARTIFETMEFANSVQEAVDWAAGRTDTLILVTADHETGGLTITQNNGEGSLPDVNWSTTGHTATNVPVYAWGFNANAVLGTMDNTEFFEVATTPEPSTVLLLAIALPAFIHRRRR